MTEERMICIIDANILFDFQAGECFDTLFSLPFDIRTSNIAAFEIRRSYTSEDLVRRGLRIEDLDGAQTFLMYRMRQEYEGLSIQDISVFLLARQFEAYLISGDKILREFGKAHSIECHGTIWLLEQMLQTGILCPHEAVCALRKMLTHAKPPRRLPRAECEKRIKKWESIE